MGNLVAGVLNGLSQLCYFAGRNRTMKWGVSMVCVMAIGALLWARGARFQDLTIYPMSLRGIRTTMVNRYVQVTGTLSLDGAYEAPAAVAGLVVKTNRFIPLTAPDGSEPLYVLDDNLPADATNGQPVTLLGKIAEGMGKDPLFYLKVEGLPSMTWFDIVNGLSILLLGLVIVGAVLTWLIRRVDYALSMPLALTGRAKPAPAILWFGSLGSSYGDVVLRQVPVSFRAIPAEARFTPEQHPELWTVTVRRLLQVDLTTIASSFGPLPAVRMQFEDERGIIRAGVLVTNKPATRSSLLEVLRFVGR